MNIIIHFFLYYLITSSISYLLFTALLWVPSLYLLNLSAFLLSFADPVFKSSMTLFSYGANPTDSLIIYLINATLFPSFPFLRPGLSRILEILVVINPLFKPTANPFILRFIIYLRICILNIYLNYNRLKKYYY